MGVEGEDFRGNPNAVVYTDDELDLDDSDYDIADVPFVGVYNAIEMFTDTLVDVDVNHDIFAVDDDDDEDWEPLDEEDSEFDDTSDDDELRLSLVNGSYVQVGGPSTWGAGTSTSDAQQPEQEDTSEANNIEESNKPTEEEASTPPDAQH